MKRSSSSGKKTIIGEAKKVPSKLGGTPIKMLIDQELSKDKQKQKQKQKPPSVVAKLMGLEVMPAAQPPPSNSNGSIEEGNLQNFPAKAQQGTQFQGIRSYEEWQKLPRKENFKVLPPFNGRSELKKSSMCQNFVEVEKLAADANLLRSKEYRDALDVLSLNQDLFLKFLEDRNLLPSKNLNCSSASQRITVLKPSKSMILQVVKPTKPKNYHSAEERKKDTKFNILPQPTKIVVLKPGPGNPHNAKATVLSLISTPLLMEKVTGSKEIAKEITREMWGSHSNRRDNSLPLSIIPNEYAGDESSFDGLDNFEFRDSMISSPISQHSCGDEIDRNGSPVSMSLLSHRSSYRYEPSVIREAKKRISKRWAIVASHGFVQEAKNVSGITTLGEMLAVSEINYEEKGLRDRSSSSSRSCCGEGDPNTSISCFYLGKTRGGNNDNSPKLLTSKSVPASSSVYENINTEAPESSIGKPVTPKEVLKSRNSKSSFKERLSLLFSYKSKKNKSIPSCSTGLNNRTLRNLHEVSPKRISSFSTREMFENPKSTTVLLQDVAVHPKISPECALSFEMVRASESLSCKQEQPSPVSVLDAPFNDDSNINPPETSKLTLPQMLSRCPPIESLSCSYLSPKATKPIDTPKHLPHLSKAEEAQQRLSFAFKLLASAGLENEISTVAFSRWYSPECPLDPTLLFEAPEFEQDSAKWSEWWSSRRLVFDCINSVILDMGRKVTSVPYHQGRMSQNVIKAWGLLEDWFSEETANQDNDGISAVNRAVWAEVTGDEWMKSICREVDEVCGRIRAKVLDELVEETLEFLYSGS